MVESNPMDRLIFDYIFGNFQDDKKEKRSLTATDPTPTATNNVTTNNKK
jgi:hypothetical protein